MSVKLADTLAPMWEFPVAEGKDIVLTKNNGTEKSIQKMYDDGELSGDLSQFIGTQEEWDNLNIEEKAKYDGKEVIFTNGETQLDSDKRIVICIGDSYNKDTEMWNGWGICL